VKVKNISGVLIVLNGQEFAGNRWIEVADDMANRFTDDSKWQIESSIEKPEAVANDGDSIPNLSWAKKDLFSYLKNKGVFMKGLKSKNKRALLDLIESLNKE